MSPFLSFAAVKTAARGRWPEILPALNVPRDALRAKHGPCPGCGGKDRYRFDDRGGDGTWYCSGGGEPRHGDGFDLLGHVHGWAPAEALEAVGRHLGVEGSALPAAIAAGREARDRCEIEEALLHELYVLLQVLQARASSRYLERDSRFRVLRPEWRPVPDGQWERERLAVKRILTGLGWLYG